MGGVLSGLRFLQLACFPRKKNLYIPPEPIDHRITEKTFVLLSRCFSDRSEYMPSQDSEVESYVVDYITNPKVYGDVEHYGWTIEEEGEYDVKGKEETSSY